MDFNTSTKGVVDLNDIQQKPLANMDTNSSSMEMGDLIGRSLVSTPLKITKGLNCTESIITENVAIGALNQIPPVSRISQKTKRSISIALQMALRDRTFHASNPHVRPRYYITELISLSIENSPSKMVTQSEIFQFIVHLSPYYLNNATKWHQSIRRTLYLHDCFIKVKRTGNRLGSEWLWTLHENSVNSLKNGSLFKVIRRFKAETMKIPHRTPKVSQLGLMQKNLLLSMANKLSELNEALTTMPASSTSSVPLAAAISLASDCSRHYQELQTAVDIGWSMTWSNEEVEEFGCSGYNHTIPSAAISGTDPHSRCAQPNLIEGDSQICDRKEFTQSVPSAAISGTDSYSLCAQPNLIEGDCQIYDHNEFTHTLPSAAITGTDSYSLCAQPNLIEGGCQSYDSNENVYPNHHYFRNSKNEYEIRHQISPALESENNLTTSNLEYSNDFPQSRFNNFCATTDAVADPTPPDNINYNQTNDDLMFLTPSPTASVSPHSVDLDKISFDTPSCDLFIFIDF